MADIDSLERSGESGLGPIRRTALHDTLVTRLRDMIIEGRLAPGTRLHEGQLGEELGVSRTPLREAIKYLASEGLVDLVPSRGAVVKRFNGKDVEDMLTVLRSLEELAGGMACTVASDADINRVRVLHDRMIECYKVEDRLEYYKLNQQIHSTIVEIAGNGALAEVHGMLQRRLKRIRFVGHEGAEKWAASIAEHEAMILALEARDAKRLQEVLGFHLHMAWIRVRDTLDEAQAPRA
jgi:DNA-binding GntR family transcriptional regulator